MNNYCIISGSTRENSQSTKVSEYLANQIASKEPEATINIIDLSKHSLPQWHEGFWQADYINDEWDTAAKLLSDCDGIVIVAPEWNGMTPPALMNIFLLASKQELSHKPAFIVGVSGGAGGAYPVTELRAFGYKNNQICYMPDSIIVRQAGDMLNGTAPQNEMDDYLRTRIDYTLDVFSVYCQSFKAIRHCGLLKVEQYPYGM